MTVRMKGSETSARTGVELVEATYEMLLSDDAEGFLRAFDDERAEVVYPPVDGVPWCGTFRGPEAIRRWSDLHDEFDPVLDFRIDALVAEADRVVALGAARMRAEPTGREWETRFAHAWTLRGGRVERFEVLFDTAALLAARGRVRDESTTESAQ